MSKVRIRVGFNQAGFLYSVRNLDSGVLTSYVPGLSVPDGTNKTIFAPFPHVGGTPTMASAAAEPLRCWQLTDKVEIEDQDGRLIMEGFRGDYLLEGVGGDLLIAKCGEVREVVDLSGDISRIYRNTPPESFVLGDNVVGRTKSGTEF